MNSKTLTLGSLFDGSGGFPLGGLLSGITPVWASEIEPFPIRVTTKRLPQMKHYGDVSKLNGAELPPVDIITFGSPCQDMSVAGKRAGLSGSRSNLFYEAVRIVKEMRCKTNGKYPRFVVWENVPGAFSSNKGEDFKAVLEEICKIKDDSISVSQPESGKWTNAGEIVGDAFSVAWRVFDAQYWGVPQRRKRIYLVADFAGECAGEILFEQKSLSGDSPQSVSKRKTNPTDVKDCFGATGFDGYNGQLTGDVSSTIVPQAYGICSKDSNSMKSDNPNSGFYKAETSRTLDLNGGNPSCNQGGIAVVAFTQNQRDEVRDLGDRSAVVCANAGTKQQTFVLQGSMNGREDKNGPQGDGINEDVSFTLNATDKHAVAYGIDRSAFNQGQNAKYGFAVETEKQPTMVAKGLGAVAAPTYSSSKASFFTKVQEEKANTLVATDYKDPPIVNDNSSYGFYPQMKAECITFTKEKSGCIVNGTNPGFQNGVLEPNYIVRRLTPTECARLQGFPDWWCSGLETENPTDEELAFWRGVFKTCAEINGTKVKSDKQIIKWLKNPNSDSAEYKMWGNGVALPCVYYVLSRIVKYAQ